MVVLYAACTVNFLNHRHHDNRECHHYHACKDLDPVPRSDLSITIQKSPRLALWFRFSCRLTLYCTTTFSSLDFSILLTFCTHLFLQFFFFKSGCVFSSFRISSSHLWSNSMYFAVSLRLLSLLLWFCICHFLLVSKFHCRMLEWVLLKWSILVVWFASGIFNVVELGWWFPLTVKFINCVHKSVAPKLIALRTLFYNESTVYYILFDKYSFE